MKKFCCFCIVFLTLTGCCSAEYVAAVVEYNLAPNVPTFTPQMVLEENAKYYQYQIEIAKKNQVQIIVFPEYGLTGITQNVENYSIVIPDVGTSDFSNYNYILLKLSNAAEESKMYIVINILEKANNTNNKTFYYNTNVVFSNNGTLAAKYRKINLWDEPKLTPGDGLAYFTTDFGTFGLMTCADILYYNPSQSLLVGTGVTDVIWPAAWNSYLPFYMSLEVGVGYALANKVNLLASNINDPFNAKGGSGIFSADGSTLKTILTDRTSTDLAFAQIGPTNLAFKNFVLTGFDVLDNKSHQVLANYKTKRDFQFKSYVYKTLDLSRENITEEICHKSFCCSFNILALKNETNMSEIYKLMAYDGKAKINTKDEHIRICNLVACLTEDVSTCAEQPSVSYTTKFRHLLVWGNFDRNPEGFYRPATLRGNLEPVYNVTYLENKINKNYEVSFNIAEPVENVVLFGLYGRNNSEILTVSLLFVAVLVVIQGFF